MNVVPTLMTISAAMPLTLVCGRAACVGQECLDTAGGLGAPPDNGGGGTAPHGSTADGRVENPPIMHVRAWSAHDHQPDRRPLLAREVAHLFSWGGRIRNLLLSLLFPIPSQDHYWL